MEMNNMTQNAPAYYSTPSQETGKGQIVVDPGMTNTAGYEINSSTPSAQPAGSNSKPDVMKPTMAYAPQMPSQPQQPIAYQIPFCESPVPVQCPVCQQRSVSKIKHVSGGYTYGWAGGLCAVFCLGCIPFCVNKLKNVEHHCGSCDEKLATWHRANGRVDVHAWGLK